jgi:hypothetical protein
MAAIGRLIVTLAAEVVGYSRLIRADEKGALEQLRAHRDQFVYPKIAEHSGRIVKATDDNLLVEFESPTEAVQCAVELQSGMIDRNIRTLPDRRITFSVGVTMGQVTGNGDDLVIRAVAALPRDTLATLIKPGCRGLRRAWQHSRAPCGVGRTRRHLHFRRRLGRHSRPASVYVQRHRKTEHRDRRSAGKLLCHERGRYGIRPAPRGAKPAAPTHEVPNCRRRSGRRCYRWRLGHCIVGVARHTLVDDTSSRASGCGLARAVCRHYGGRGCPCGVAAAIPGCEQHGRRHRYPNTAGVANPACQRHGGGRRYASTVGIATLHCKQRGGGQPYPSTVAATCPIRNRCGRGQR